MSRQEPPPQPKKPGRLPGGLRDLEDFAIRPTSREEERELYAGFYERLYEYMQKGRLDFHYLAERLSLRERRIRECMLFRLSSGEVMQLFGLKKGFCFVCEGRLHTKDTPEPACLGCLNAFERALEERYGRVDVSQHLHRSKFLGEPGELRALRVDADPPQPENPGTAIIPASQNEGKNPAEEIAALREELDRYRKTLAAYEQQTGIRIELISPAPQAAPPQPQAPHEETQPQASQEPAPPESTAKEKRISMRAEEPTLGPDGQPTPEPGSGQPPPYPLDDHEFLAILDMEESQVSAPTDVNVPDPIMAGEPLRHYGFKRIKKKEA